MRDLNIEVSDGELMVLVGPSGSGKSTTLRLVAGLETPTDGDVYIGDKLANDLPPSERDIAMVFQGYALYPHLSVERNLGFGLKMRGAGQAEIRSRVAEVAGMLGIGDLLQRKPKELSGGQRQRVALGRALARNPRVFLFDEPLSNLDASLRVQLRREIKGIHEQLGVTMIYVTHDQTEAMALGQRIAVMNAGIIEQIGAPSEIYRRPESMFVAGFFGSPSMNLVGCEAIAEAAVLKIRFGGAEYAFRTASNESPADIGSNVFLGFRPEDIAFGSSGDNDALVGCARVASVEAMGAETLIYMKAENFNPVARILGHSVTRNAAPRNAVPRHADIEPGSEVEFGVAREALHFFRADSGRRIRMDWDD